MPKVLAIGNMTQTITAALIKVHIFLGVQQLVRYVAAEGCGVVSTKQNISGEPRANKHPYSVVC